MPRNPEKPWDQKLARRIRLGLRGVFSSKKVIDAVFAPFKTNESVRLTTPTEGLSLTAQIKMDSQGLEANIAIKVGPVSDEELFQRYEEALKMSQA